jgi:hypothetical protein
MFNVVLESTDEAINEEILWKICAAMFHERHPLFICIDVTVHRGELL